MAITTTLELVHGGHSIIPTYPGGSPICNGFWCEDCDQDVTDLVEAIPEPDYGYPEDVESLPGE